MKNLKKLSLITLGLVLLGGSLVMAQTIHRYRCPKCNAIYSYSQPGVYKCPSDGWILAPMQ